MLGTNPVFTITITIFYVLGFICAALAILRSRTPQGAVAWVVGLVTMPFFTVPLFIVFGHRKFYGYNIRRKSLKKKISPKLTLMQEELFHTDNQAPELKQMMNSISKLCQPGFTRHNEIELLIDAKETYTSMLEELEKAQCYIIFQFYVFRADAIGNKFAEVLMRKARQGVKVNFLYDEIGTEIPSELIDEMITAGMDVCHFNSLSGKGHFQINFRNHRKILIVDGRCAYVGGLNIGDDYLGLWKELGPWRDTHVKMSGPSVLVCQMIHAKDWYWCKQVDLNGANWKIQPSGGEANILILPTGPADNKQSCLLSHISMVNAAQKRLWIANPYLVPPESLLDAILLAALRGVDVRIVIPSYSDAWIVMVACQVYVARLLKHGIKVYRYQGGFLHEKVILVDHLFAVVGSANFDFRSMFINFEITLVAQEKKFIQDVENMLIQDFKQCKEVESSEFKNLSLWQKITTRAANLMAPLL